MIEIYLLEQLVAFETYGTLSAAAEYLHISQPALSHSMQKLEELMGVPLFHRQKNRLALNENGRLTAEYARKILEQERDMVEGSGFLTRAEGRSPLAPARRCRFRILYRFCQGSIEG